jgi:ATP-dependent helicase HepA
VGHPFVEALEALVRADERGTAYAMWRYAPGGGEFPHLYFRFDFVIEANIEQARIVMKIFKGSIEALRRRADEVFPVEYRTIWLDSDLKEVTDKRILATLGLPYSQKPRADGGRDTNVRLGRWAKVDTLVSVSDWGDLCYRARKTAERLLREERVFLDRCQLYWKKAHDVSVSVDDALRSRIYRLAGAARKSEESMADFEREISQALAKGIENPSLRLDSTGTVFLSRIPWTEE